MTTNNSFSTNWPDKFLANVCQNLFVSNLFSKFTQPIIIRRFRIFNFLGQNLLKTSTFLNKFANTGLRYSRAIENGVTVPIQLFGRKRKTSEENDKTNDKFPDERKTKQPTILPLGVHMHTAYFTLANVLANSDFFVRPVLDRKHTVASH